MKTYNEAIQLAAISCLANDYIMPSYIRALSKLLAVVYEEKLELV